MSNLLFAVTSCSPDLAEHSLAAAHLRLILFSENVAVANVEQADNDRHKKTASRYDAHSRFLSECLIFWMMRPNIVIVCHIQKIKLLYANCSVSSTYVFFFHFL